MPYHSRAYDRQGCITCAAHSCQQMALAAATAQWSRQGAAAASKFARLLGTTASCRLWTWISTLQLLTCPLCLCVLPACRGGHHKIPLPGSVAVPFSKPSCFTAEHMACAQPSSRHIACVTPGQRGRCLPVLYIKPRSHCNEMLVYAMSVSAPSWPGLQQWHTAFTTPRTVLATNSTALDVNGQPCDIRPS